MNIFTEAAKLEEQNCPFAMAQIVDSRGSTPRHSAQMLVRADGSIVGTIGGGMVERKVIEESLQALQERKPRLFHGRMARNGADAVGSDCGGAMSVFISVHGMRPRLVLIGAGHVNRAIAQSAALLGFDIAVADIYRESLNPELFPPSTTLLHAESFGAAVEALDICPDNFVLIATNNQDREALDKLIEQPIAWLGLLASRRKVQLFLRQLREKGVAEEHIARLHAPVGYNIGAETPQPLTGMVRGLLNDGLAVVGGFKIGDIDPRGETADFTSVSDKARAIGGGVLEALMMLMHQGVKATKEVLEVA